MLGNAEGGSPEVTLETSMGSFTVELYYKHAPGTCRNFIELSRRGYYDNCKFHRIIKDFIVQCGDPTGTGRGGESIYGPKMEDEIKSELKHTGAGILSMANAGPNTNGSQFFITLAPAPHLDGRNTIFGRVCRGMEVIKRLGSVQTDKEDRMENHNAAKLKTESKEKTLMIYKDFVTRITVLENLGALGNKLLNGFKNALECLRRPPMNNKSELMEKILKANETKRMKSYLGAGSINIHDNIENMSKLRKNLVGLQDHISKAKSILNEFECLLEDVAVAIQTANRSSPPLCDEDLSNGFDQQDTSDKDMSVSSTLKEPEITEIAALMGIIYSMVKQDYMMQERIVTSLNLKLSSEELEGYCMMWSLRPFINDETMHQAWRLVP